ncbi:MAG: alpha/beta hydrolase [Planctomycetota bacterium]|nr:alpha/beta hydrolase [Planctomycetota bacterium]
MKSTGKPAPPGAMLLEFAMKLLDGKAKLRIEAGAGRGIPDHLFTVVQLRLLPREKLPPALHEAAARKVMLNHLNEYGATACETVLAAFAKLRVSPACRKEVRAAYAAAQKELAGPRAVVYRTSGIDLNLRVFAPRGRAARPRPAILFLFGGGWYLGKPEQFFEACRFFARKGFVAMTVDYRTKGRNDVPPAEGVKDVRSAVRYVRTHAGDLGIDSHRICLSGWSAGGHLAAAAGSLPRFEHADDDRAVSCRPDAVAMIAPGLNHRDNPWFAYVNGPQGAPTDDLAPLRHVQKGQPPTLTLRGAWDRLVSSEEMHRYDKKLRAAGIVSRVEVLQKTGHREVFKAECYTRIHRFLRQVFRLEYL